MHPSIQHKDIVQTLTTTIHTWLPIQTQHGAKHRQGNTRHVYNHKWTKGMQRYTRLHDSRRNKNSNHRWCALGPTVRIYIPWLAINENWGTERTAAIQTIQGWDHNHYLNLHEGRKTIVCSSLQKTLNKLHLNHVGLEKTRLLVCEPIYWVSMNADIPETVKNCPTHLDINTTQLQIKPVLHEIPRR